MSWSKPANSQGVTNFQKALEGYEKYCELVFFKFTLIVSVKCQNKDKTESLTSAGGQDPDAMPFQSSIDRFAGQMFLTGPPSSGITTTVNTSDSRKM